MDQEGVRPTAASLVNSKNHGPASDPLNREIDHLIDGLRQRVEQRTRELVDAAVIAERRRLRAKPSEDVLHAVASDLRHIADGGSLAPETLRAHAHNLLLDWEDTW